ncbi:MAG: type II toxin-antitoxin system HicB family antitoxin [Propionibacteriaceae bacterium]|nr:type II toxin-antitoxin system HicB family antitoxin [Propionibacteriaceae bacterium]
MKTAISVPDHVSAEVEAKVRELGMSRSHFYATAAARYLRELSHDNLVARVNEAYDLETTESRAQTRDVVNVGMASSQTRLGAEQW